MCPNNSEVRDYLCVYVKSKKIDRQPRESFNYALYVFPALIWFLRPKTSLDCSSVRNRIVLPSGRSESARKSTFEMYVVFS